MKHSVNYNLNKPDYTDQYDLRHWNENTDIVDIVLKSLSDALSNESSNRENADSALLTRIQKIINGETTVDKSNKDGNGNTITDTYQTKGNKVDSWQSTPDNNHYPSEKLVKDTFDTNISYVNGMKLTKIWENSQPNSAFAEQTINLGNVGGDIVIAYATAVGSGLDVQNRTIEFCHLRTVGKPSQSIGQTLNNVLILGSDLYIRTRPLVVQIDGGTNVKFYGCRYMFIDTGATYQSFSASSGQDNMWLVPVTIYKVGDIYNS